MAFPAGQEILDPIPLVVAKSISPHRSVPQIKPTAYESLKD
ncbi:hypothetical protein X729_31115 [Mesorhizobium sp. L103C131B0]|nr:hypothetical protein X729_31115 [Mesorhizobium sp. L103C131B0]